MNLAKKTFFSILYGLFMQGLTSIKLSFILGSKLAFFSLNQCLTPVIGFFAGTKENILIFGARTAITFFWTGMGVAAFTYHLPTLSGTLYLTTTSRIVRAAVPLACILLFIAHPVGSASIVYTLYWFPLLLMSFKLPQSIFLRSLASTLTTHAVGSTLWLYSHQTDPLFWHSLISIVWIERLLFASCMTAAYYGVTYAQARLNRHTKELQASAFTTKRSLS